MKTFIAIIAIILLKHFKVELNIGFMLSLCVMIVWLFVDDFISLGNMANKNKTGG